MLGLMLTAHRHERMHFEHNRHIYIYVCIYIYMYIHVHIDINTRISLNIDINTIYIYIHTHTRLGSNYPLSYCFLGSCRSVGERLTRVSACWRRFFLQTGYTQNRAPCITHNWDITCKTGAFHQILAELESHWINPLTCKPAVDMWPLMISESKFHQWWIERCGVTTHPTK